VEIPHKALPDRLDKHITLPHGYKVAINWLLSELVNDTYKEVTFVCGFLSSLQLLAVGYAFEQAAQVRLVWGSETAMEVLPAEEISSGTQGAPPTNSANFADIRIFD
jgi:hypothetical protein